MKKLGIVFFFVAFALGIAPANVFAEVEAAGGMVKVMKCPHCDFAVMKDCPMCGARLEEKEMTAAEAQAAIEKSRKAIRGR